jgi:hypothetical protein
MLVMAMGWAPHSRMWWAPHAAAPASEPPAPRLVFHPVRALYAFPDLSGGPASGPDAGPIAASLPGTPAAFAPANAGPIFISPNFNASRASAVDMLLLRASANVDRMLNERAKSDYGFLMQELQHIQASSVAERISRTAKEAAAWVEWQLNLVVKGLDAPVVARPVAPVAGSEWGSPGGWGPAARAEARALEPAAEQPEDMNEWSHIYFDAEAAVMGPAEENGGEDKDEAPAFELIDTVIAGRWRRRRQRDGSKEEIYFDGSQASTQPKAAELGSL